MDPVNPLWTPKQLADYFGVKVGTVYAWVKGHQIPHVILSKGDRKDCVRFRQDEIEAFLRKRHRKARDNRSGRTKRPQNSKE
jgi:excisionase family DNA binding protein